MSETKLVDVPDVPDPTYTSPVIHEPEFDIKELKDIMDMKTLKSHMLKLDDVLVTTDIKTGILKLDDVVTNSELLGMSDEQQTQEILERFNDSKHMKCFTRAIRGTPVNKGEFRLGVCNNTAELVGPTSERIAKCYNLVGGDIHHELGTFKQSDLIFGAEGKFVLNVPPGKYALTWFGNEPHIHGPGIHIIRESTFKADKIELVDQSSEYIYHGTISIIRTDPGKLYKVRMGKIPYLMNHRPEPYVFKNSQFNFDPKTGVERQTDVHIKHGSINVIRVPAGSYGKISINGVAYLIPFTQDGYVFNHQVFEFDKKDTVPQNQIYIEHKTIHILQIPAGKVVKVKLGSTLHLLESRPEPYMINNPGF